MFQYDGLVVGQRIRNLRIEAGYGLGEFSDELGKSESHIKQVELGSRKISLDLLISLMEVLHVDANSILGRVLIIRTIRLMPNCRNCRNHRDNILRRCF